MVLVCTTGPTPRLSSGSGPYYCTGPTPPRPGSLPDRQQSVLDMLALIQVEKNGPQPQLSQKLRLGGECAFDKPQSPRKLNFVWTRCVPSWQLPLQLPSSQPSARWSTVEQEVLLGSLWIVSQNFCDLLSLPSTEVKQRAKLLWPIIPFYRGDPCRRQQPGHRRLPCGTFRGESLSSGCCRLWRKKQGDSLVFKFFVFVRHFRWEEPDIEKCESEHYDIPFSFG